VSARQQCACASPDLLRIDDSLARHRLHVELAQIGKELVPRLPRGEQCGADAPCKRRYDRGRLVEGHKVRAIVAAGLRPYDDARREQQPDAAPLPSELVIRSIRDEWALKEAKVIADLGGRIRPSAARAVAPVAH